MDSEKALYKKDSLKKTLRLRIFLDVRLPLNVKQELIINRNVKEQFKTDYALYRFRLGQAEIGGQAKHD